VVSIRQRRIQKRRRNFCRFTARGVVKNPQFDLARKYARRDVAGALQWTRRLPAGVKQEEVIGVIVEEWAKNEPAGAKKFAGNAPAGAATYIPAFARSQWHAQQRSREALRIASELRPGELREETLAYLVSRVASDGIGVQLRLGRLWCRVSGARRLLGCAQHYSACASTLLHASGTSDPITRYDPTADRLRVFCRRAAQRPDG
jgi:hypothetical protein